MIGKKLDFTVKNVMFDSPSLICLDFGSWGLVLSEKISPGHLRRRVSNEQLLIYGLALEIHLDVCPSTEDGWWKSLVINKCPKKSAHRIIFALNLNSNLKFQRHFTIDFGSNNECKLGLESNYAWDNKSVKRVAQMNDYFIYI